MGKINPYLGNIFNVCSTRLDVKEVLVLILSMVYDNKLPMKIGNYLSIWFEIYKIIKHKRIFL